MPAPEQRDRRPLLAPGLRVPALVAVVAAAVVVTALGLRYAHESRAGGFDRAVDGWLTGHGNHRAALWLADLGNGPVVLLLVLALLAAGLLLRSRVGLALVVLAPAIAPSITEWLVKPLVHRTKDGYLAYPSGHITGFGTVAFVFVLLVLGPGRDRFTRRAAVRGAVAAMILALACAVGLVASDYHYATDVLGGIGVAAATVLATALVIDAVGARVRASSRSPR